MSSAARTPYLGRYLLVLVLITIGLAVLGAALNWAFQVSLPSGATTIIPPMATALHVGQIWGRERGEVPTGQPAWRFALAATAIFLALQMLLLPLAFAAVPEITAIPVGLLVGMLVFATIAVFFVNRYFLGVGAKGGVKGR